MQYITLPNFLRTRERRRGRLTEVQSFAMICFLPPGLVTFLISPWMLIPDAALLILVLYGLSPREGSFLYETWIAPLRVLLFPRRFRGYRAFEDLGRAAVTSVPIIWRQRSGEVLLAAHAKLEAKKKGGRP